MTDAERLAMKRYYAIMAVNLLATAGAVFGLVLAGRLDNTVQTVLGGLILLSAMYLMAVVPRAMARRWKTPEA